MKKSSWSFIILLSLFIQTGGIKTQAQDARLLSLDDVIRLSQVQSPDALKAKHRFKASFWEYRTYQASFRPALTLNSNLPNLTRSIIPIDQPDGSVSFRERSIASSDAELSLNQSIPFTGGQIFMKSRINRIDYLSFKDSLYYSANPVILGLSQPLFGFNSYHWSRLIDPKKYEEAQRTYVEDMEQVAITVTNFFFRLLEAQIQKEIAAVNLANYDTLYKIAIGRFNLGRIAENELLQLELQYLRSRSTVENTNFDFQNRLFELRSYLRLKEDENIILIPPARVPLLVVDAEMALNEARKNRSDAIAFERRLVEAERDVSRSKLENRFNANLYAELGYAQDGPTLYKAYQNPQDGQIVNLGITIPILDWGLSKGRIKMAESNQELVQTSIEQERIDFDQEVRLNVRQFNMQSEQVYIASKADTVAMKGYEISKARYLIGKISITDLNIAQTEANTSKGNYINALWRFWSNLYTLRKLTHFDFIERRTISYDYKSLL